MASFITCALYICLTSIVVSYMYMYISSQQAHHEVHLLNNIVVYICSFLILFLISIDYMNSAKRRSEPIAAGSEWRARHLIHFAIDILAVKTMKDLFFDQQLPTTMTGKCMFASSNPSTMIEIIYLICILFC